MSLSIDRFWKLTTESQLLSEANCAALADKFAKQQGAAATTELAARWLIDEKRISAYQAKVLLAGRPGPFVYGDYRIYDRIESGRMAGIFRALHIETKFPVCLYFLSGAAAQEPEILHRLAQQAVAAHRASVGHPHLSRCYHLADEKSFKFIVLQDLQGKRLERRLATGGALPPAEACRVARQTALGLGRLHAMGLIHGDVRPGNIWLDPGGTSKLLLFPLSRDPMSDAPIGHLVPESEGRKKPPQVDYIAPELIDGGVADARSDIYSLGCTLYHALANQAPFAGGDLNQKLQRHRTETPVPLDAINSAIPPALAKLVNYMMAKDPDLRYQQANSVVEALLPHLAAGEVETQPRDPSRRSQAYEAWLSKHLAASAHAAPAQPHPNKPAAPVSSTPPALPDGEAAAAHPPLAATPVAASNGHAPVAAAPVAAKAIPAAVAAPLAAQPLQAVAQPLQAVAQPMAAVAAAPVRVGFPSAMPIEAGAMAPVAAIAQPMTAMAAPVAMAAPLAAAYGTAVPLAAMPATALPAGLPGAMPMVAPELDAVSLGAGESSAARARRAARKNQRLALIAGLVMLLLVGGGFGIFLKLGGQDKLDKIIEEQLHPGNVQAPSETQPAAVPVESVAKQPEKPAKPQEAIWSPEAAMWPSPTHGKPADVAFLAPGPEAVIVLRPAELLSNPQGEKLLDRRVLGSLADWVRNQLPAVSGTGLENISQVVVGVLENSGTTRLALVVHVKQPVPQETLLKAWGDPAAEKVEDKTFYKKDDLAYYIPTSRKGSVIVIAPPEEMRDVVSSDGHAVLLPLHVERLLHQSDGDRMLTAVIGPGLMTTAGKGLFSGAAARLKEPLEWFLTGADPTSPMSVSEPRAVMFSCDFNPDFFAELRVENDEAGPQSPEPAKAMRDRLKQLAKKVKLGVNALQWTPYSENVLIDLPEWVSAAQQYTRVGSAEKELVLRTYLPAGAAANLALGGYLCLLENPRGAASSLAAAGSAADKPQTAADKLKKVTSLSFPNNPLDKTIALLSDDIGVPMEIDGPNFQLDGITKNQAVTNLNEQNKPASEILRAIMLKARPDDKIVYVFTKLSNGSEGILITTRAGVAKEGYKLPPELEVQPTTKKKK